MAKFESKYDLWNWVYISSDPDQLHRQVTGVEFLPGGIIYYLACGTVSSRHYEQELSLEKNYSL